MSRVHDALRKAAQDKASGVAQPAPPASGKPVASAAPPPPASVDPAPETGISPDFPPPSGNASPGTERLVAAMEAWDPGSSNGSTNTSYSSDPDPVEQVILRARQIPFTPSGESLLVHPGRPKEPPAEEFRSLRTRLNHMQRNQPLHTLVISSASPGEGKTFTACNLAISQSQLVGKRVLLADFDFRRPTIEKTFGLPSSPGITDYLLGNASLSDILFRIKDSNLYVLGAGSVVSNPLELLNLKECSALLETLRDHFDWVILDSPPLLFAADGNLLATMCDGAILVVRIATTTYDSVSRALQSLCENNVLGIVVNGARRGELYSKYSYYHNYYYSPEAGSGNGHKTETGVEEPAVAGARS